MQVVDIKQPNVLRGNGIKNYLKNSDYFFVPSYFVAKYQCLIYFDRIIFSSSTKTGRVKDVYKINNRIKEIRTEILQLGLPENTLLLGGFYHPNHDVLFQFTKGLAGAAYNLKRDYTIEYVVSDILHYDGTCLLDERYEDRRTILEELFRDEQLKYVRLVDIYKDEQRKEFVEQHKGSIEIFHRDSKYKDLYWRHNDFDEYYVVISDANIRKEKRTERLSSFTISMFKKGELVSVGAVSNIPNEIREASDDPSHFIGKIALVSSRAKGKKLLNPKLVKILDETDYKKCKW